VVTTGANAETISNPQPSVVIFARGHYSWVSVGGSKPRPACKTLVLISKSAAGQPASETRTTLTRVN
jgi:hypothetical protein